MKVIGFCNLKGGVGKTTACQNLAVALARKGLRVAALDLDPQSNLTAGFGISLGQEQRYIFDFLTGDAALADIAAEREGVWVAPSSLDLAIAELQLESEPGRDTLLRDALASIPADAYDVVFCDSPPQLGLFTRNVLAAVDELLVPLESEFFSLAGLRLLTRTVQLFRKRLNRELTVGGVILTRHNPKIIMNREVQKEVRNFFGDVLYDSTIRQCIGIVEASGSGMSVLAYDPGCNGARDYERLAGEFLERVFPKDAAGKRRSV
jgi:chromosome partitioning protein